MPASLPYAFAVLSLIAGPSVVTASIAEWIGDPRLRPMSIDEERLARADIEIEASRPQVRVRIYWSGAAPGFPRAEHLSVAMRAAFDAKGVGAHVAVIPVQGQPVTTLEVRAGTNAFGPLAVDEAAQLVNPAAAAARLAFKPRLLPPHLW